MTDASATLCTENAVSESSFAALVDDMITRLRTGEKIEPDRIAAEHPLYAARLHEIIPSLRAVCDLSGRGGTTSDAAGDHADLLAGVLGEYRILRQIGRGGMGVVYEAIQTSLNRRVALKVLPLAAMLDPRHLQRFKNESLAAASLDHPNIVNVYAVGCERGVHFYAMRYVEGQTLAAVIEALRLAVGGTPTLECDDSSSLSLSNSVASNGNEALPEKESDDKSSHSKDTLAAALSTLRTKCPREFFRTVAELGIQAADGLEHAHQLGIVHRDIKPSNLMIESRMRNDECGMRNESRREDTPALTTDHWPLITPHLYIADFGLARIASDPGTPGLTMTGDLLGTLRYMSPEQAEGKSAVLDHRTDIYSLGITLYELATLRPTFPAEDRQSLLRQIACEEPLAPRRLNASIPADLETILLKSIAKIPRDRYASARQLADDLRRFLKQQPITARRPSFLDRTRRWGRRHVAAVMSLVIVLAMSLTVLGVALAFIFTEQQKTADALDKRNTALLQAQANLDVAAEAVDKLYTNFAVEWLASETAPSNVQQEFLRLAADFYQRIIDRPGDTQQDRLLRVTAYQRIGELETYLESYEKALPALEMSLEIGRELQQEFPADIRYRETLSVTLYNLGNVHRALNDLKSADDSFREALEHRQSLPAGSENTNRQIAILLDHAKVKRQRRELDQAHRLAEEAREKVTQLAKQTSRSDTWRLRMIDSDFVMAGILLDQGRLEQANNDNQKALSQCQFLRVHSLADYRPLLHNEAQLTAQAARIADRRGQLQEAITLYRSALDLMRQGFKARRSPELLTMDSMARKVRDDGNWEPGPFCSHIEVQLQLAGVLRRAGRPHEAELEVGSCVLATSLLVAIKPRVLRYQVASANAWAIAGDLLADRPDESKSAYRIAARYWLEALQRDPDAGDYRSGVHAELADLEYLQQRLPGDVSQNAASTQEWGDAMGDNLFAQHARATVWFRGKSWEGSLHFAEKAAQLRKKDHAYDWLYIAMSHAHLGKPGVAQKWYDMSAKDIEAAGQPPVELIELLETTRRLIEEKRAAAGPPALMIAHVSTPEGGTAVFNVTLSDASATPVTVNYSTADGSAQAGVDYEPTSGTLTIAAGEITRSISIPTIQDTDFEDDETFMVKLASASAGVTIGAADATATILRSDMPQVGLASHWTADNTPDDAKGKNHGTLIDGAAYAPGQIGQAFSFDGVDDRVQVPDSPSLAFTESMTIEGWIRVASLPLKPNGGQILFRGDDRGGLDPYALSVSPGGMLIFRIHGGANEAVAIKSAVLVGQFVHVAATLDDATGAMRLYLDGALVSEKVTAIRPFAKLDPASNPGIGIGNHGGHPASNHNFPFHGLIDELKVYDKPLSAEEVAGVFQTGKSGRRSRVAINDDALIESVIASTPLNE